MTCLHKPKVMSIDIETFSDVDLGKQGVYKYAQSPNFEILTFAYAYDNNPVEVVDLTKEPLPEHCLANLTDPSVTKTAFNASFERICINTFFGIDTGDWDCTMIRAWELGYAGGLANVGAMLKLKEEERKINGSTLIRTFCCPRKPSKNNPATRWYPEDKPDKWEAFVEYNRRDVEAERNIRNKLLGLPIYPREFDLYHLDQRINDRGILIDTAFCEAAIGISDSLVEAKKERYLALTGISNPNSLIQLKEWIKANTGVEVGSVTKETLPDLIKQFEDYPEVVEVLKIRALLGKTSVAKYHKMLETACEDNRSRGNTQFFGAKTGRWCLTGDHEVLTENGWVRLDNWDGGAIACWTPNMETVTFRESKALKFEYEGDMYHYKSKRIDQISTPDHKMYYKPRYDKPFVVGTVENMAGVSRPSIPFVGYTNGKAGNNGNVLRILVMVQADGHFLGDGGLRFAFIKQRKVQRCKMLLRKEGILFAEKKYKQKDKTRHVITVSRVNLPIWLKMFKDKTFGSWLYKEDAGAFFDELQYWDGYREAKNTIQYVTTNKRNADVVQAFAHMSGRAATMNEKHKDSDKWSTAYMLDIWETPKNAHEIRNKPEIVSFKGYVYCAETPTGFFLVRRNGVVWVTGNSGRNIQLQNLPQNHLEDLDTARGVVSEGDYELVDMLYPDTTDVLRQCIRTAIIPPPGKKFIVADFSAIEARVIAWLAGEQWRLDVFEQGGDIYCTSASQMFGVPVEKLGINGHLRQKGKVAELALGYAGSVGALKAMGALKMGIPEEELPSIVSKWRKASPHVVELWHKIENGVLDALTDRSVSQHVGITDKLSAQWEKGILFITLPSGRRMGYVDMDYNTATQKITYTDQVQGKVARVETYYGKLTENVVQATARDCLAYSMMALEEAGYKIIFHVHDEVIIEVDENNDCLDDVCAIMGAPIPWAEGLPLRADGYECNYYKKD